MFFIDYGNTDVVTLKDLREITPDLVDRLPKGFAIRCSLELTPTAAYEEFLAELIESEGLLVKCKSRNEQGIYCVDLYNPQTKDSFIEMFKYENFRVYIHIQQTMNDGQT